jgi:hypothetical protein
MVASLGGGSSLRLPPYHFGPWDKTKAAAMEDKTFEGSHYDLRPWNLGKRHSDASEAVIVCRANRGDRLDREYVGAIYKG